MPSTKKGEQKEENFVIPPDGGYGWVIVVGATLTHLLLVGTARSLGMIYEDLRNSYGGSAAATAWVAAIFNTCRSIIAPVCGLMCKKLNCRTVAMLGGLVMAIGLFISAFANSLYYLYVTFAITGFGGAMVFTPAYVMVGNYFDKNKGKAMAFATTGSGLGSIIMAPTITMLLHTYTFFGTMIIVGGLQLHNCVAGALYTPLQNKTANVISIESKNADQKKKPNEEGDIELEDVKYNNDDDDKEKNTDSLLLGNIQKGNHEKKHLYDGNKYENVYSKTDKHIDQKSALLICSTDEEVKNKEEKLNVETNGKPDSTTKCCRLKSDSLYTNWTFYMYGYLIMSMQVCIQSYLIFLPGYAEEKGANDTEAALVLSIFGFSDMVGRFIFGFMFDLKWISTRRRDFYCLVSSLFGLSAMSITFMPNFLAICIMTAVVAIFEGATHSQRATVLSDFVSHMQMPTAVGVIIFCQGVGNIWGPPFAGVLRDITGTNAYGFIFCGSVMFSAALFFYLENWMRKHCCKSSNNTE